MEFNELVKNIEAMIFASDRPLPVDEIQDLINHRHQSQKEKEDLNFDGEVETNQITRAIETITEKYAEEYYPFEIKYTGGGYCFLTKKEYHEIVAPVCQDKKIKRLSSAAMETLAIVAYKQPVTKAEIEYLRGVSAEYSVHKLMEKELIVMAGRKEDAIGKPILYKTAENFLDYLGIHDFDELPQLKELFDINKVQATAAGSETNEDGASQDSPESAEGSSSEVDIELKEDNQEIAAASEDLERDQSAESSEDSADEEHQKKDQTETMDVESRKEALQNLNSAEMNVNSLDED